MSGAVPAPFHALSPEAALDRLASSRAGLGSAEAQVRLARHGPNRLPEPVGRTRLGVFLAQFRNHFIYLLLAGGLVSLVLRRVADAAFIFGVLLLNGAIGAVQEWQAEARSRALRSLIRGTATAWRDGRLVRLSREDLVPGDMVRIESGERVGADLRLVDAHNVLADESLLTGESLAVRKHAEGDVPADAPLADRYTILHAGTIVRTGRATGVVIATGRDTAVGSVAAALSRPEPPPPLVRRMARFTRQVSLGVLLLIALIAALELARGADPGMIFLLAVALAVSAIPEGLPVAMTVALSIASHRMARRNVIVRHLPAVEGLGACTCIATDKTGTLTLNLLTVRRVWVAGVGDVDVSDLAARPLLHAAAHASEPPAADADGVSGDAVDLAFVEAAAAQAWSGEAAAALLVGRIPYEPEQRFAAAFHRSPEGGLYAYVKGAPETVALRCSDFDDAAVAAAEQLSARGARVLAVAGGPVARATEAGLAALHLYGFASLIDPPRPEARAAIAAARAAGVDVRMITGDHPLTALAIARELGLAARATEVVTGAELAGLDPPGFDAACAQARIFARTEPLQKLAIVESLRRQGQVVAVTGDGVNDAPALHAADIGVAMGKGGTDVAREAADLILTDDNFASIVAGIEEGRVAYANLRKVILLLIATGAGELLLVLLSTLSGLPAPLSAVQLLWLNLVTNGLQDVALAFETAEPDVLHRHPRAAAAPIFDRRMVEEVLLSGGAIGLTAFAFYFAALAGGLDHGAAQGAVLWVLVWCENAHCFNSRSETRSVFHIPLRDNPLLVGAVAGTQLLQVAVLGIPALRDLLSLQAITPGEGLRLAALGLVPLAAMEGYKRWRKRDTGQ